MDADLVFVQLSDAHLQADATAPLLGANPVHALRRVIHAVTHLPVRPAFCLFSGDLSNDGSLTSYAQLQGLLAPLAAREIPVLLGLGNHDDRAAFRQAILGETGDAPYYYTRQLGSLRVIMLDSLVPGEVHGWLDDAQLAWLDKQLQRPAPGGDLIVVHHPVTRTGAPWLNDILLHNASALREVLAGRRILGVLAGHCHHASLAAFAGAITATAPGVIFQFAHYPETDVKVRQGSGFNLCTLSEGHLIVNPIILPS